MLIVEGLDIMNDDKKSLSFKLTYDTAKDCVIISLENTDGNLITIPSSAYTSFISVLIKAGIDFQKNNVVDLGLSNLITEIEGK